MASEEITPKRIQIKALPKEMGVEEIASDQGVLDLNHFDTLRAVGGVVVDDFEGLHNPVILIQIIIATGFVCAIGENKEGPQAGG